MQDVPRESLSHHLGFRKDNHDERDELDKKLARTYSFLIPLARHSLPINQNMQDTYTSSKMATRQQTSPPILKNGNQTTLQQAGVVEVQEPTLVHPLSPAPSMAAVDGSGVNLPVRQPKNG